MHKPRHPGVPVLSSVALVLLLPAIALAQPCAVPALDDTLRLPLPQVGQVSEPGPVVASDFDRDGASDLVLLEKATSTLRVIRGRRDRDFRPPRLLATPPVTALYAALELKGNGKTDLLVESAAGPTVLAGDGRGGFRPLPVTGIEAAFPPERWSFADLDGDQLLDVVVFSGGARPSLETFLGNGEGGFRHATSTPLEGVVDGTQSAELDLGDTDGDGRVDAVVSAYFPSGVTPRGTVLVVRGNGRGGFDRPAKVEDAPGSVDIGDLDGDGRPDLLVRTITGSGQGSSATATVYWGAGDGTFSAPQVVVSGLSLGSFLLADLDGDGRPDLVSAGRNAPLSLRRLATGRTFGPPEPLSSLTSDSFLGIRSGVDLDGDGRADLAEGLAHWPAFKALVNRCDGSTFARTFVVPAVVSIPGVGGTYFSSEVVLTNRGTTDVTVDLTYVAARGGGSGHASIGLPAGRQRILEDAIADLCALGIPIPEGEGNAGSLRVRFSGAASPADVSAQSRVRSPFARGEVGVGVEPVPALQGPTGPSIVPLLRESALDRTNLALVSLADEGEPDVTLRVHLFPTDGTHAEPVVLPDIRLAPGAFVQLDRVLASAGGGMASAWARIERVNGDASYAAYAVLNDNASADGSVVAAVPDTPNFSSGPLLVPTVAETDRFTTELVLTSTVDHEVTAYVTFASPALGSKDHRERLEVPVPAGGQASLPAFAKPLCARWESSGGSAFPCAGMLTVEVYGGVHAVTRTTASGDAGRFGVAVQAQPIPVALGAPCWIDGLRQDDAHRTNVGLVNTNYFYPARYRLDVFDGDSGTLAATVSDVEVDTGGWRQIDGLLATYAPGVTNAYARVVFAGGWPYEGFPIAYGVLNDGSGAGQGNGDGTMLQMRFVPR